MNTLADRVNKRMAELELTQEELGKLTGMSQTAIFKITKGQTAEPRKILQLARALHCSAEWLKEGKDDYIEGQVIRQALPGSIVSNATWGPEFDLWDSTTPLRDDEVALPFFREVRLSAGAGISEVQENHGCKLRFSSATLRRQSVDSNNAACVNVSGNSMEPVLPNGTTVGIDTSQKDIVDGKMYAIDHGGHLRVKLLYRLPSGGIRLRSYNQDEYPDELYKVDELGELRILGKVFWYSVLL